jgi:hypothetical protein
METNWRDIRVQTSVGGSIEMFVGRLEMLSAGRVV